MPVPTVSGLEAGFFLLFKCRDPRMELSAFVMRAAMHMTKLVCKLFIVWGAVQNWRAMCIELARMI